MAGATGIPVSSQPISAGGGIRVSPAAAAIVSQVSEGARFALAQRRPWMEMVDKNSFARPENFSDALSRVLKNIKYFRINYGIVLLGVLAMGLITHWVQLLTLGMIVACWVYLYMIRRDPLVLWGRTFTEKEILFIMSVLTLLGLVLTSVGALLISAGLIGVALITVHGALRVPDDLFLDDQEPASGFLSFLGPGIAQPPIASHV